MDSVKTAYHNAEHALWGDTGRKATPSSEEPISGIQGAGTATDPYDAGNLYPPESTTKGQTEDFTSQGPVPGSGKTPTGDVPVDIASPGTGIGSTGAVPQDTTTRIGGDESSRAWSSGTDEFPSGTSQPIISSRVGGPTSSGPPNMTGQGIGEPKMSPLETSTPFTGGVLARHPTDTSTASAGSGLSPASTGPLNPTASRTQSNGLHTKRTSIGLTSENASPEFLKEQDDAPRTGRLRSHPSEVDQESEPNVLHSRGPPIPPKEQFPQEEELPSEEARRPMQTPSGMEHPAKEQVEEHETHEAPKEEYVKTTGFAAEGGNFDATLPGAGREAERLMGHEGKQGEDGTDLGRRKSSASSKEHHGGLWRGTHKSGITMANVKEKLHIGKHHP